MNKFDPMDAEYQRSVAGFVNNEVFYCVSSLISELCSNEKYAEDLYSVLSQYDYEEPAIYHINDRTDKAELISLAECYGNNDLDELKKLNIEQLKQETIQALHFSQWQGYCEAECIEPYQREALEHWIVSDWLADKLEEKGEIIKRDFLNLTLWGRSTSGQSISMDGVITSIYNELHAEG
jgi:bisphosphoglycerate-dependent phosphoglycerate mutase